MFFLPLVVVPFAHVTTRLPFAVVRTQHTFPALHLGGSRLILTFTLLDAPRGSSLVFGSLLVHNGLLRLPKSGYLPLVNGQPCTPTQELRLPLASGPLDSNSRFA